MAGRWFRFYDDALHDPKVQMLPPRLFKLWINLLCVASRNGGALPNEHELAYLLRERQEIIHRDMETLSGRKLFDLIDDKVVPHNWDGRQFQSDVSTERVREFRQRQRNVSGAVTETANETVSSVSPPSPSLLLPSSSPSTDPDTEQNRTERTRASRASFDLFWLLYPHKVGKEAARKAFVKAIKVASIEEISAGLHRYVAKTDDRPWCNPATWLNQHRWTDQPATGPPQNGNGRIPRPGSYQDRQEKMANVLQSIDLDPNAVRRGEGAGEAVAGLLPFRKPAGP